MNPFNKIGIFFICAALIGFGIYHMKQTYETSSQTTVESDASLAIIDENTPPIVTGSEFIFEYDKTIAIKNDDIQTGLWRINTQIEGTLHERVVLPETFQPQTNFRNGTFTIGSSKDPQAIKKCLVATNGERARTVVTINNTPFHLFTLADAGMSNYYDSKSYRAIHDGACFAIEYTIHSLSMGVFTPEQNIGEFNTAAVVAELEKMVQSFKFAPQDN